MLNEIKVSLLIKCYDISLIRSGINGQRIWSISSGNWGHEKDFTIIQEILCEGRGICIMKLLPFS